MFLIFIVNDGLTIFALCSFFQCTVELGLLYVVHVVQKLFHVQEPLVFLSILQSCPHHSCGNLKGLAARGTNQMLHSELPLH